MNKRPDFRGGMMVHNDGVDQEVKRKITGILFVLFPTAKVYLYGSRARGDFSEYSDIDLALDNGKNKERLALGEAQSALEGLNHPYKIDLVDLNHVSPELREIILKEGVLWNNKKNG